MDIQKNNFLSIEQVKDQYLNQKKTVTTPVTPSISFNDILKAKSLETADKSELRFSKHAANRLIDRNISLSDEQKQRLTDATVKAGEKGIKESLVLMDSLAFVVNIPNNTVITALDKSETDLNVFTNIDGAVII
ncbi:MAG: flagellar protein [Lachnospiraceae bacterium]|jgi:flagellar operon protein|nr:flagellar protein [Lachnospiraceae bacterium]